MIWYAIGLKLYTFQRILTGREGWGKKICESLEREKQIPESLDRIGWREKLNQAFPKIERI
jgi:hypothetical protein